MLFRSQEIRAALDILSNDDVTLLHCTGGYPTAVGEANINRILDLAVYFFPLRVGFSAHIPSAHVVASSVLYGAEIIEVHFDLEDRRGIETGHSFTPSMLEQLVLMSRDLVEAKTCACDDMSLGDVVQRKNARRNAESWLRD